MARSSTSWSKGQSGNPKGRPKKGETLTDAIRKQVRKRDVEYTDPKTGETKRMSRRDALAKKLWSLALAGDVSAIKYLYDRLDGKPVQDLNHDFHADLDTGLTVIITGPSGGNDGDQSPPEAG